MLVRRNVVDELNFDPSIYAHHISVSVEGDVVTLSGHVPNYAQKALAALAAKRIKGVRQLIDTLSVELDETVLYSDVDLARRALTILDLNVLVPPGKVKINVKAGWLSLSGEVDWEYQRLAAVEDLRKLRGVKGVTDHVALKRQPTDGNAQDRIEHALKRSAEIEAGNVLVSVLDGRATLKGKVDTWADRLALQRMVWSAEGVQSMDDNVQIA